MLLSASCSSNLKVLQNEAPQMNTQPLPPEKWSWFSCRRCYDSSGPSHRLTPAPFVTLFCGSSLWFLQELSEVPGDVGGRL